MKSILPVIHNQVLPWEPSSQKQWKDLSWSLLYGKKLSSSRDPGKAMEIKPLGYQWFLVLLLKCFVVIGASKHIQPIFVQISEHFFLPFILESGFSCLSLLRMQLMPWKNPKLSTLCTRDTGATAKTQISIWVQTGLISISYRNSMGDKGSTFWRVNSQLGK